MRTSKNASHTCEKSPKLAQNRAPLLIWIRLYRINSVCVNTVRMPMRQMKAIVVVLDPYEVLIKITTGNCVFPNICNENKCSVPGVRYKYESFSDGSEDAGGR